MADSRDIFDITVQTIHMLPPIVLADNTIKRQTQINEKDVETLIAHEAFLRRAAYKNTTLKTDASFFNDTDMPSNYCLVVVYDKLTNTPLLSARHYFDTGSIAKFLKGDNGVEAKLFLNGEKFNLADYSQGTIFLADRLSGNTHNSIYRHHRNTIFSLYYSEIKTNNKNRTLLLMVRKEKHDKQLSNYLNLGFNLVGSTLHKGKEHSIILLDFKNTSCNG